MTAPTFSFEFFPPKTDKGSANLQKTARALAELGPSFMTVTCGAGGSTRDKTLETALAIQGETGVPIAVHLTYINIPRPALYDLADRIWDSGIRHIVALRGDMPDDLAWPLDPDGDYFQYTSHFVAALKARRNFEISVGAYPEKHPDAPSLDADIEALHKKCDAGADRAITQFFFDNNVYYDFAGRCKKAGITRPIVPGLLPIHDFKSMCGFAEKCRANVPDWMGEKFKDLEEEKQRALDVSTDILVTQVMDLAKNGVPHFHFYTLNKADIVKDACLALKGGACKAATVGV